MSVSYDACVFFGIQIEGVDYDNEPQDPTKTYSWVEVGSGCYGGESAYFLVCNGSYVSVGDHSPIFVSLQDMMKEYMDSDKPEIFENGYTEYCASQNIKLIGNPEPQWYMGFSIT